MPFLRFTGVAKEHLQELAPAIIREISGIIHISEEKEGMPLEKTNLPVR